MSTVADTLNGYGGFGFYAPSINNRGQVAFEGLLTDFTTDGVFTGPNPKKDAIITSSDKLDRAEDHQHEHRALRGRTEQCGRDRLHSGPRGQHPVEGFRSAIYLATPKKPLP